MEAYAGKQFVGIDLHRRRTVIVRTTELRGTSVAARCSAGHVHGLIMTFGTDTLLGDMPLEGGSQHW